MSEYRGGLSGFTRVEDEPEEYKGGLSGYSRITEDGAPEAPEGVPEITPQPLEGQMLQMHEPTDQAPEPEGILDTAKAVGTGALEDVGRVGERFGRQAIGVGETAMSLSSGLLATSIAGVGLLGSITKNMLAGDDFETATNKSLPLMESIPSRLTYQPMSAYGQELTEGFGKAMEVPRQIGEMLGDDIVYYLNGQAQLMKLTPDMPQYELGAKRLPDIMGPEYVKAVGEAGLDVNRFMMGAAKSIVLNHMALDENFKRNMETYFDENEVLPPELIAKMAAVVGIPAELWIWGKGFKLVKGHPPKLKGMTQNQFRARERILKDMEDNGELPKGTVEKFDEAAKQKAEEIIENGQDQTTVPEVEKASVDTLAQDAKNVFQDPEVREVFGLTEEKLAQSRQLEAELEVKKASTVKRAEQGTLESPTTFYEANETGIESWQEVSNKAKKPIKVIDVDEAEQVYYPELRKEKIEFVTDDAVIERMRESAVAEEAREAPVDEFIKETNKELKKAEIEEEIARQNKLFEEKQAEEGVTVSQEEIDAQVAFGKLLERGEAVEKRTNPQGRAEYIALVEEGGKTHNEAIKIVNANFKKRQKAYIESEKVRKAALKEAEAEEAGSVKKINKGKKKRFASKVTARGQKNYKTQTGLEKRLKRDYGDKWQDEYWIQGDEASGFWAERVPEMKDISPETRIVLDELGIENPTPRQIANAHRLAKVKAAEATETYLPNDTTGDPHQFSFEEKMFNIENALKRAGREPEGLRIEYFKEQIRQLKDENVLTTEEMDVINGRPDAMYLDDMDIVYVEGGLDLDYKVLLNEPRPTSTVGSEQAKGIVKFTNEILADEAGFIDLFSEGSANITQLLKDKVAAGMSDYFYDRPNVRSGTYSNIFNAIEDYRINQNLGAFDAQLIRTMLYQKISSEKAAKDISGWLEGKKVELGPQDQIIAEVVKETYKQLGLEMQAEGILNEFVTDYVNHIIKPVSRKSSKYSTKQAISFIKQRVRKEGSKDTLTIDRLKEIGKEKGFTVEEDIRQLLPIYFYYAKRSLARKRFANHMVQGETETGHKVMYQTGKVPEEVADQYVDMVDVSPIKRWSRFGRRSTGLEDPALVKERSQLFRGDVSVHRDAWKLIENLLAEEKSSSITLWDTSRAFVKRLIMFNPLIHGFNVESNVLLSQGIMEYTGLMPGRAGRLSQMGRKSQAELTSTMRRMVKNGVQLEGLYEVGGRLAKDSMELRLDNMSMKEWLGNVASDPMQAIHPADLFRRLKTVAKINDILLWDRIVKTGQVAIYRSLEGKYLRQGYSPEHAGKMAAMQANDYLGTMPKTWYTKKQRTFMRKLLFARDWNVGLWRSLTGAAPGDVARGGAVPKFLRFEGVTPEMMGGFTGKGNPFKGIKGQYRQMLVRGALYLTAFNTAVQMGLLAANDQEVRPMWENETGHKLDIDTGTIDAKGRKVYMRGWLFRQISEYAHLAAAAVEGDLDEATKVARNKLEPILNLMIGTLMNIDFMNEPIRDPGADPKLKTHIQETARYAAETLTPVDTLFGRRNEVRNMTEKLIPWTGTFIRHGMPAGGDIVMANMLKDYYDWLDVKNYKNKEAASEIEEMIQLGDWDESLDYAMSAMYSGHITKSQFENMVRRNPQWGHALFGRISTPQGKLETNFQRFLQDMGEHEPEKFDNYQKQIDKVAEKFDEVGTTPIPESTKQEAKLSIFKIVQRKEGGYVNNPKDPGGETIFGISRHWQPDWEGWKRVDFLLKQGTSKHKLYRDGKLNQYAGKFYNEYWDRTNINDIRDPVLQELMFEFMFNAPKGATRAARRALGLGDKSTDVISPDLARGLNLIITGEERRNFIKKFSEEMKRHYTNNSPSSFLRGLNRKVDQARLRLG